MKRQSTMLANVYKPSKHKLAGNWLSVKLDGIRCLWDGGVSRGINVSSVPWANTVKDKRFDLVATGLWSRYFKPIYAPDWWLDRLPAFPLDGELWCGVGNWQTVSSITGKLAENRRDEDWERVDYRCFDVPSYNELFADGPLDMGRNVKYTINGAVGWCRDRASKWPNYPEFEQAQRMIPDEFRHEQVQLPFITTEAEQVFAAAYDEAMAAGHEGLIIRKRNTVWAPYRSDHILKVKPRLDSEAVVVGYRTGRRTDLGSRLLGKMGALIVSWQGVTFDLSGFTDEERELSDPAWAEANPETVCPENVTSPVFPIGSVVTFRYRELSDSGIPKEAAYWRKHG